MGVIKDLTGQRFGRLTAKSLSSVRTASNAAMWNCVCDCGKKARVRSASLTTGNTTSCGCAQSEDLTGKQFNYLTVLAKHPKRNADRKVQWRCLCHCGKKIVTAGVRLTSGHTKSCGCTSSKIKDLTGKQFGYLTVLGLAYDKAREGARWWHCQCECGNKTKVRTAALNNGSSQSCGCKRTLANSGTNHHRVKNMIAKYGEAISQTDPWYQMASRTMGRAKAMGIPIGFESRAEMALYLRDIAPKECPALGKPFVFGKRGRPDPYSPSLDKIVPSKGYVRGNLQIISNRANSMKFDASREERIRHAQWTLREELK